MALESCSIDFIVKCQNCGKKVTISDTDVSYDQIIFSVDPCEDCLQAAEDEGRSKAGEE